MAAVPVLLLLVAAAGTAREYTDEDRTNFPKLFHLDEYERCLARPGGLYCLGTFDLTPAQLPHPTYELMKAYSDESYRHFNRTRIHRGYCVSQRCPTHDTSLHFDNNASLHFESNSTLRFERCADRYARRSSFRASLQKFHYCRTHTDATTVQPPTTAELLYARVVYAVVLANIIGTLYDVYTGDAPNKNHLLTAFSIPANWQRLTEVHEGGDPRLTALACINGFRVIALGFTTFAHATVLQFTFHILKPEYLEQLTQRLDGIFLSDGSSLIQAFVMTSCFLTGYNLLIFSQKRELGLHMLPLCIIKRVIRITPVHLLLVGYGATWWMNSRDGPLVPTTIGLESQACKTKFWHHLFYVNNIVDNKDYCVAPTWFLPVDMHMYILACTLTLLLWRRRCTALKLYIFLFAASCLLIGIVAYVQKYKSMIYMATPEELRVVFRDTPSFTDFYMSSWGALPSCFVGLILAHIQFELVEKKIKLSEYKWFVYMLYTTFSLLFIWPLTGIYVRGKHSRLFYAAYIALDRPFYCILMAICLLGSFHVDNESYRHFNRTRIHRGYCVSQRCPTHDTSLHFDNNASLHFESNSTLRFERCADRYARRSSFRASLQKFHYCRTHTDATTVQPPTTAELLYARVVYAVVLANIIGTLYDVYTGDAPNKNHLLTAFSIPANWQRLTEVHEGGDPRLTALACINGFRVIALGFTTFAHATVLQFTFHILKPEYLEQLTQRLDGIFLSDGSSLIQAFVMTSCFLTGYNLLIFSQKRELGLHMLPLCIIKRVIRITPVHLLLVGYGATWWMNSRDGPLVPTTIGLESQACKTKFWHHLFYVNNIVDNKDYCVAPTWFLPVDMHMYILACTLTLLLWRRRCTALKLYIFLFAASCLLIGIVAYVQKYKSMIYMATPEELRVVFRDTPSFTDFYMSSWGALPSCFVGLILAHIQFELVEKKIKLSEYKWFVYMLYTTFSLLFIWPLTGIYVRGKHSRLFYAAYIALDRPFYCILMAICLLGSFHVDNPPRRFFRWRGWHSMARLSLTVMMLHWCINITIGSRSTAYSTSILDTFVDWIATNFLTYVVAIPITILVETPMQRFLGVLLFTRLR